MSGQASPNSQTVALIQLEQSACRAQRHQRRGNPRGARLLVSDDDVGLISAALIGVRHGLSTLARSTRPDGRLGPDGGCIAVPGVHLGVLGQREESLADGAHDRGKVRKRPSGGARAAAEQGVTGEQYPRLRQIQTARPRLVPRGADHLNLGARYANSLAVVEPPVRLLRMGHLPQHVITGMQQHRAVQPLAEFGGQPPHGRCVRGYR